MASLSAGSRGPYKCKKRTPRQTRFYRRQKSNQEGQSTTSNVNVEENNHSEDEENPDVMKRKCVIINYKM